MTALARDIMIPLEQYPHIPYWFTIRQALVELEQGDIAARSGRRSLPRVVLVFDQSYQLLGLVRRRDLLKGLGLDAFPAGSGGPFRLFRKGADPGELGPEVLARLKEHGERQVSEVMSQVPATVDGDDSVLKTARLLVEHDVSLLPVLEGGGVAGVVRTVEVLNVVASLVLDTE
jgi:hypothetical protein